MISQHKKEKLFFELNWKPLVYYWDLKRLQCNVFVVLRKIKGKIIQSLISV